MHWTAHWQVKGCSFYGDHLLFARMYEGLVAEIDSLAEKIVAEFGSEAVDAPRQAVLIVEWVSSWQKLAPNDVYQRMLSAEDSLQGGLQAIFTTLEERGYLSLGMNDYLAALANAHETNQYLLRQRVREHSMGSRVAGKYLKG